MSFWILIQVVFDFLALAGVVALWIKISRPSKDDPRLSRGLQLLQTKISVLEDLSDRTETQVTQLTALMEHKVKEIQQQILSADKHVQLIDASMSKSLEVAKIFQDRIPHQEIVERKNTIKYVKAARMAHQGASVEEIAQQVDLSLGEIEFIAKVNKNQLQFSEEDLPEWVREEGSPSSPVAPAQMPNYQFEENSDEIVSAAHQKTASELTPQPLAKKDDRMTLSDLGDRFRQAISGQAFNQSLIPNQVPSNPPATPPQVIRPAAPQASPAVAAMPAERKPEPLVVEGQNSKGEKIQVRKVVFRRVDPNSNPS